MRDYTGTTISNNTFVRSSYSYSVRVQLTEPPMDPRLVQAIYEACAVLDLELPLADKTVVQQARKRLARLHHPDAGGDLATMQAVNAAADFLLKGFR